MCESPMAYLMLKCSFYETLFLQTYSVLLPHFQTDLVTLSKQCSFSLMRGGICVPDTIFFYVNCNMRLAEQNFNSNRKCLQVIINCILLLSRDKNKRSILFLPHPLHLLLGLILFCVFAHICHGNQYWNFGGYDSAEYFSVFIAELGSGSPVRKRSIPTYYKDGGVGQTIFFY